MVLELFSKLGDRSQWNKLLCIFFSLKETRGLVFVWEIQLYLEYHLKWPIKAMISKWSTKLTIKKSSGNSIIILL